jgi:phytase-like protein
VNIGLRTGLILLLTTGVLLLMACLRTESQQVQPSSASDRHFNRIAFFPLHLNKAEGATAAEIVVATLDGKTALYADSLGRGIGFINLSDPHNPKPDGYVPLAEEPTSLAVTKRWALVVVDHGKNQGSLLVLDLGNRQVVARHDLPGQPDAITVSPDKRFAVVAVENEPAQDFPSTPPGSVAVISLQGEPQSWMVQEIALEGLDCQYPDDPEPEFVAIDRDNIAVVSLQENNHIVMIDLESSKLIGDFSAGTLDLAKVDLKKDKRIQMVDSRVAQPREPDSVDWCSQGIVTADEGDLHGGSRSWTLFDRDGTIKWNSGAETEHVARNLGQYPDRRSEERGTEPEAIKSASYGEDEFVFVGCERSNLVLVYKFQNGKPHFWQALPGGPGPESVACLTQQNLLLVGAEVDEPKKGLRAYLNIYNLVQEKPEFPSIDSKAISWCALSGLAASKKYPDKLFTLTDKALKPNRILTIDNSSYPARIESEILLSRKNGTPNYDLEGISLASGGGFWLVSEGKIDALIRVDQEGVVINEIALPQDVQNQIEDHGMEGVAETGDYVYVAFQSLWKDDTEPTGHIGRYHPASGQWAFATYPRLQSHYAAGLSSGPTGEICVLMRDKLAREKAQIKEVVRLSIDGFESGQLKSPGRLDLIEEYRKRNLPVPEKPEGLAFDGESFWIVNDNDAMKDSYGETQLISLKAHKQR